MPKPAKGKLYTTGRKWGKKGDGTTETLGIALTSLVKEMSSEIRGLITQRQEERVNAALRGDKSAMEYAEAQLRYLLSKAQPALLARLGPGIRILEVAVTTDPQQGGVILLCKCWVTAQTPTVPLILPTETLL